MTDFQPALGWAALSRSALKRVEAQLTQEIQGVQDELGMLTLHTAYANRFFPGTSVQQTRLRYALFVPWQIADLMKKMPEMTPHKARLTLEQEELELAKRLLDAVDANRIVDSRGIIGKTTAKEKRAVSIPPSQSYWVALKSWGILATGLDGICPTRQELFAHWERWAQGIKDAKNRPTDDEKHPIDSPWNLFHKGLPPSPLKNAEYLDLALTDEEKQFLRQRLTNIRRPHDQKPSYLALLVHHKVVPNKVVPDDNNHPWSDQLTSRAEVDTQDRAALKNARGAAAISAVARAFYNAAVEKIQEDLDNQNPGNKHRNHIKNIIEQYGEEARQFDLKKLGGDGVHIGGLEEILAALQKWLDTPTHKPGDPQVLSLMQAWELKRKGSRRARLPHSEHGRQARMLRDSNHTVEAYPINYRWDLVRRFLADLGET